MKTLRRLAAGLATTFVAALALVVSTPAPAHAAWTSWYNNPGQAAVLACKTAIDSGYGPLWQITLVAASSPDYSASLTFEVRRGSSIVSHDTLYAQNGAWDVETTYASRLLGDTYYAGFGVGQISTGYGLGESFNGPISFSQMQNC
jgi:hypothetical protein